MKCTPVKNAVPGTMVWIHGDNIYIRVRYGTVCNESDNKMEFKLGKVTPGQWQTLVFGVRWHAFEKGWFKAWLDERLVVEKSGIKTFFGIDDRFLEMRIGIYPNWYDPNNNGHPFIKENEQRHKEVLFDSIGFGPTYADADPWTHRYGELSGNKKVLIPHSKACIPGENVNC
jgi:hypothetical protein